MRLALFVALAVSAGAFGAEIQGRVLNAQGGPVAGAAVTVTAGKEPARARVVTEADGSYTVGGLTAGVYTVSISVADGQQVLRQDVRVESGEESARADFRFGAAAAEGVAGIEERNPNIFVYRIDLNDLRNLLTLFRGPSPTYIPEFLAEENYFGAEYGAPLLSFQPLRPRTLLRGWHASASATHQNSALNARNFFNVGPLLPSRITSYDLAAGGPVSSKASLVLDFGQVFNSGMVNGNLQAPLASERAPLATDPETRAIISDLLKAYPAKLPNLPAVSLRQLNTNAPRSIVTAVGLARLDLRPTDRTSLAGLYSANQYSEDPFQLVMGQNPETDLRSQSAYVDGSHNFSPQTSGQFGFYYDRVRASLVPTPQVSDLLQNLGYKVVPEVTFAGGGGSLADLAEIGPGIQFPRMRVENRFKLFASLSRTMGRHTIKIGGSTTRSQVNDLQSTDGRGVLSFLPDFGHTDVQNFLLGTPDLFTIAIGNLYRGFRNWEYAAYLEDEFRISPVFSINMGVRYEVETPPSEVNHLTDPKMPLQQGAAPRFGFAWNPGRGRLTMRAGYGVSFSSIFPVTYQTTRFNPPSVQVLEINAPRLTDALALAQTAATMKPIPGAQQDLFLISPDLVLPYTHMYNFSLQWALPAQTVLRVAYMGSRSFHLLTQGVYNRPEVVPGIPTTEATLNQRRPDPRYGAINVVESNSNDYYDAAQVAVEKRLTGGLTFRAAYTFSKDINLGGDFTNTASGVEIPPETGTATCETCNRVSDQKGLALFDTPQVFTVSYVYRVPFFAGSRGWLATAAKGWQISGTTLFQSGVAYHFHTGSDAPGYGNVDGNSADRPNILNPSLLGMSFDNPDAVPAIVGADTCRPPGTDGLPYLHCKYFDTNIAPGGRGNLGWNTFRKDGTANWNVAIGRNFPIRGERSLDLRGEFLNFFNTPQFDKPGTQLAVATFGKITNTVNKGRQVQFTLKLSF